MTNQDKISNTIDNKGFLNKYKSSKWGQINKNGDQTLICDFQRGQGSKGKTLGKGKRGRGKRGRIFILDKLAH